MSKTARETRLQIMLDDDELAAIDDWRFKKRMPSRAATIRELLRIGLQVNTNESAAQYRKSSDFGVFDNDDKPPRKR